MMLFLLILSLICYNVINFEVFTIEKDINIFDDKSKDSSLVDKEHSKMDNLP